MQEPMFPREVTGRVPRITLTGRDEVHVEQHQGLMACQEDEVTLKTVCGRLVIGGSNLMFSLYTPVEARVLGRIDSIRVLPEGGRA